MTSVMKVVGMLMGVPMKKSEVHKKALELDEQGTQSWLKLRYKEDRLT